MSYLKKSKTPPGAHSTGSFPGKVDLFEDFRFPHKRAILRWVKLSIFCFGIAAFFMGALFFGARKRTVLLKMRLVNGEQEILNLQRRMHKMMGDSEKNNKLSLEKVQNDIFRERYERQLLFLSDVSRLIPPGAWLGKLMLRPKKSTVFIEGYSPHYQEVMSFYSALSRLEFLKRCCLKYDQRGELLKFTITADVRQTQNSDSERDFSTKNL